jgi:hypothetical protein
MVVAVFRRRLYALIAPNIPNHACNFICVLDSIEKVTGNILHTKPLSPYCCFAIDMAMKKLFADR